MSLVKKPRMTAKRLAAHRENGKHSRGPKTQAGRERVRAANLRHGFYSKLDDAALRALGEDPAEVEKLLKALSAKDSALSTLQENLGERLARAIVRMRRADRMQDGYALRQAKAEEGTRQGRLHMQMMRLKLVARSWQKLARAVARPHYVTTPEDLDFMNQLHKDGEAKQMSEVCVSLFYQLREPGMLKPGDEGFEDAEATAKRHRVMNKIRAIFGLKPLPESAENETADSDEPQEDEEEAGVTESNVPPDSSPAPADPSVGLQLAPQADATQPEAEKADPHPEITEEEWAAREPVRQLLENILTRQVKIFEAQHRDLLRQCLGGPSPYERAAEIVPTDPSAQFLQKMEDSQCRQVLRMGSLFLRLRRHERQMGNL